MKLAGAFPHELYEVTGNVYGLANAPHAFNTKVIVVMTSLGAKSHPLDLMLIMWGHPQGWLIALAIFHADDVLTAWNPVQFNVSEGKTISKQNHTILFHQHKFIQQVQVNVDKRKGESQSLLPTESLIVIGALQWLAGSTRPNFAAGTSLLRSITRSRGDMQQLNEHVLYA